MASKTDRIARQDRAHRVAVLLFERPALFEMSVAAEVWGNDRTDQGVPFSEMRMCSEDGPVLPTDLGVTLHVEADLDALEWADTVVIPSASKPIGQFRASSAVCDAVRAAHSRGARIVTFCSGAFVLADTGLLDGREATTHWYFAHLFQARFPEIDVRPDVLYAGEHGLYTSAGTASAIDLCLQLVREDWGAEVANTIARRMVVPPHREGGQAQYIEQPMPRSDDVDADLRAVLEWVLGNLDRQHTVNDLARRAAMTPRTFARRFKAATGTTPLQWILTQRVLTAQRMLEETNASVEDIALRCGFGSSAGLRQHFTRVVGSTPSAYRATFRLAA
jgi:transcriptional regulator GlxA family with amidase domain